MENQPTSIRTQIPVSLAPSQVEIVYSPESKGYSLNFGITVQLPINDLVESLLKFNASQQDLNACIDQVVDESTGVPQPDQDVFLDTFVPESTSNLPLLDIAAPEEELPSMLVDDTFRNIPISLIRQDEVYLDYVQRSKWQYAEATFLVRNAHKATQEKLKADDMQLRYLARFLEESSTKKHRTSSTASTVASSGRLSADAPVFTPALSGVCFSDGPSRPRAWSESPEYLASSAEPTPLRERAMTTADAWAPPSGDEDASGCKQM